MQTPYIIREFLRLFSDMSFVVLALLIFGIVLIALEMITPERGRLGISGLLLITISLVLRMLAGGSPAVLFLYVAGTLVVVLIVFCIITVSQKTAWIANALGREELRNVPDGSQKRTNYSALLGQVGTTTSKLAPSGQMFLGDTTFFVTSDLGIIESDKKVRVVEVRGEQIIVQEIE